jgi:glycosyltransferase involved in cell wall biosynthesis
MKNSIIVIPMSLPWDWSTDYYEQTARILARENIVVCVQFHAPITIKTILRTGSIPKIFRKLYRHAYLFEPIDWIPFRRFALIEQMNLCLSALIIKVFVWVVTRGFSGGQKYIWIFDPQFYPLATALGSRYQCIYDVVDYLPGAQIQKVYKNKLLEMERRLLESAHLVTVNSYILKRLYIARRPDVLLVPQGFRRDWFQRRTHLPNKWRIQRDRPVIGYVGGINYRLDFDLLDRLIGNNPQYTFVFAGQIQKNDIEVYTKHIELQFKRMLAHHNCMYVGNIPKSFVSSFIAQFDVCIIPYDASEQFNTYCYPMKLFEYFYMGKPVVSTPINELRRFSKYVKIGKSATDWEKHIKGLLSKPWPMSYQKEQKKLAIANSWEKKIAAITWHMNR